MLTKEQEKFLKWLLSQKANVNNVLYIGNSVTTYPTGYDDKDVIQRLNELENLSLIKIKWYGIHRDNLDLTIDVTILQDGVNYFRNKRYTQKENRRGWVSTYLSPIIAFIALLKSFDTEIIWLWKQLMKLLKLQ